MTVKTPHSFPLDFRPPRYDDPEQLQPTTDGGVRRSRDVRYAMIPGYRSLLLDVDVPDAATPPPLVMLIHGGAWLHGDHRPTPDDLTDLRLLGPRLLDAGFAVASVQYRLSGEARFPAPVNDAKAAVRWLRAAAPALGYDGSHIGTVGDSSGGYLSLFLGTNTSDPVLEGDIGLTGTPSWVDAAVSWYGPTRLDTIPRESGLGRGDSPPPLPMGFSPESAMIGASIVDHPDLARAASPIAHLSRDGAPTLLIHGRSDRFVPHQQSVAHHEALQALGVRSRLHLIDGADHCFFGADVDPIIAATVTFLCDELARPVGAAPAGPGPPAVDADSRDGGHITDDDRGHADGNADGR